MNKNKITACILGLTTVFLLYQGYLSFTGDFRRANVTYDWPQRKQWPLPKVNLEDPTIKKALKQSFSYLGQGNQTYAFISEDRNYVLKFFKFGNLKPTLWHTWLPDIGPIQKVKHKKRMSQEGRLTRIYEGHWIALTHNKENCGLIAVQLDPLGYFDQTVKVRDRIGQIHTINLDTTVFALQEKATVARDLFDKYLIKNDIQQIKTLIDQIFNLYLNEYSKGVYDRDHNVIDNVGFTETKAIHIDVGKLKYDVEIKNKEKYIPDLKDKVVKRISSWVTRHYPQHSRSVDNYLTQKIKEQGS
ncbi:MAG: hypothetical protein VX777_08905 [Chlamydiota bacterium]|nr:hypothetical protein [Chlamydiota bacterium]